MVKRYIKWNSKSGREYAARFGEKADELVGEIIASGIKNTAIPKFIKTRIPSSLYEDHAFLELVQYLTTRRRHEMKCVALARGHRLPVHEYISLTGADSCACCNRKVGLKPHDCMTTLDVPAKRGGEYTLENTILLCMSCFSYKFMMTLDEFQQRLIERGGYGK